eukprot:5519971-Alexandrium_andersonii.AAC.1
MCFRASHATCRQRSCFWAGSARAQCASQQLQPRGPDARSAKATLPLTAPGTLSHLTVPLI